MTKEVIINNSELNTGNFMKYYNKFGNYFFITSAPFSALSLKSILTQKSES